MTTEEIEKKIEEQMELEERGKNIKCSEFTEKDWDVVGFLHIMDKIKLSEEFLEKYWGKVRSCFLFVYMEASGEFIERYKHFLFDNGCLILNRSNARKWLKCRMEQKKISKEEYLKKLLIISKKDLLWNDNISFDIMGEIV